MNNIIPVMVHHETGEKAQAAGKKNQEYIKYCIAQAKKYNEKVVLLGDQYNKAWCDEWYNADDFITEKWERFHKVFENLSTYPDAWAEGIFKRFFLILEYLERNKLENCVIIDSDVLLSNIAKLPQKHRYHRIFPCCPKEMDFAGRHVQDFLFLQLMDCVNLQIFALIFIQIIKIYL